MEKKTFEISQISSVDNLNALSIALNEKEHVSHMKIGKENITFSCIDIDDLLAIIQNIDPHVVVKEVIDGIKREYDFAKKRDKTYYFMIRDIMNNEDIQLFIQRILEDDRYHDVHYDEGNQLLTLVSSHKDVFHLLRKELDKINPSVNISEHRKPIRSQDVFNQKYLKTYFRLGLLMVSIALAMVTSKDDTWLTPLFWTITTIILSETVIKDALKQLRLMRFFQADVIFLMAIIMGIASGVYFETCLTVIIYQLTKPLLNIVLRYAMSRVNRSVELPEKGILVVDGKEKEIPLNEFEKGDIMVVPAGETVMIGGKVKKGVTMVNTYPNTSDYELVKTKRGMTLYSGDINVGEKDVYIQLIGTYDQSRYTRLMNLASTAPIYESKLEKYVKLLTRFYTPMMMAVSIVVGIIFPLMNYKDYGFLIHVGAVLMILATSLSSDQSTSLSVLSGFAKAFQNGIILESSLGLDSINATQTIVYDRFDGIEVTEEEWELFKKLSHMGKTLIIFNDGPVDLDSEKYMIYNNLSIEEKLNIMDTLVGPIVYIGDGFKDVALLQKSYVGISRGGIADSKVVENSDIVLIDSDLNKVFETFKIARSMRTRAIINSAITILVKLFCLIAVVVLTGLPLYVVVIADILTNALVLNLSTSILE